MITKERCPLCDSWASKTRNKGKIAFKCQKCGFVFKSEEKIKEENNAQDGGG